MEEMEKMLRKRKREEEDMRNTQSAMKQQRQEVGIINSGPQFL